MGILIDLWRRFRRRILPDGSSGQRAYHRFRLRYLFLTENRLVRRYRLLGWRGLFYALVRKIFPSLKIYPVFHQFLEIERLSNRSAAPGFTRAYLDWIRSHEPSALQLLKQKERSGQFIIQPLISIITPVYNPAPQILTDTIASVRAQTYPKWEWCLADGCDQPGPSEVLLQAQRQDARVKVIRLAGNGGISANTNAALSLASGEYVLMLDHDDLLAPDALFEIVTALNAQPDVDVIYYDEDKVSADGRKREEPWFKPRTFSPILLFSTNTLMHSAIRTSLIRQVLPLDSAMDGAQDWDMAFRLSDLTSRMVHIPRVLYHWRRVPGSVASQFDSKPWAFDAQKRCLQARLDRIGANQARVDFAFPGTTRIIWPPSGRRVSIIIPTRDNSSKLRQCLDALLSITLYPDYEVIVVDNGSKKAETFSYYREIVSNPHVRLLSYDYRYNFQRINNLAARQAVGEILVFLNDDTQPLAADWLTELTGWLQVPEVGVVGAKLIRPDGSIQHGGIIMGLAGHGSHLFDGGRENSYGFFGSSEWYRDVMAVTGACLAMDGRLFSELGGFDESYQVGYGDIDLCLRATEAGKRVVFTPFARLIHHEGSSRGAWVPPADVLRASAAFMPRIIAGDPYFNPNLSSFSRVPAIAGKTEPPRSLIIEKILQDFELCNPAALTASSRPLWWSGLAKAMAASPAADGRKLILVTHELSRTGAPLVFLGLALSLKKAGYDVSLLSPSEGPLAADFQQAGIEVTVLPFALDDGRLMLPLVAKCDFVLANTVLCWRAVYAAHAMGKKVAWFIHEGRVGQEFAQKSKGLRQAFQAADVVYFLSQTVQSYYQEYLFEENYQVLPAGIFIPGGVSENCKVNEPPVGFNQQFCKANVPPPDAILRLINIASVEHRKGQDILLEALDLLDPLLKKRIHLLLIGKFLDRSEPNFVRRVRAKAKKMPNVQILGELDRNEVLNHLRASDGLILTSRDEALPIVLLEAMSLGKPVLSTAVGGIPEVIQNGINGVLFTDLHPETIARGIAEFANNPEIRSKLGAKARKDFEARPTLEDYCSAVVDTIREFQQEQGEVKVFKHP